MYDKNKKVKNMDDIMNNISVSTSPTTNMKLKKKHVKDDEANVDLKLSVTRPLDSAYPK